MKYHMALHQAEIQQAQADEVLISMQQEQMQPVMVQDGMEFSDDSLGNSSPDRAASKVTYTDYMNPIDSEIDNNTFYGSRNISASIEFPASNWFNGSTSNDMENNTNKDSYMWKLIPKRDRPSNPFNFVSGLWGEANTSQHTSSLNNTAYARNWGLMQNYFHWDCPLPAPKKPRIYDIDLNLSLGIASHAEARSRDY